MKRFDSEAIVARMMENFKIDQNWVLLLGDGTINHLINTIAEGRAEDARYMEYLLGEKKWLTARNISSLQSNAVLIGYKRQLPQSAIGFALVAATDDEGKNRLSNLGTSFFDINAKSDYDDLTKDENASKEEKVALTPWTCDEIYTVPKYTRFIANNSVEFFSINNVSARTLKHSWTEVQDNEVVAKSFYENGAWNGIKYLKIPVVQGIRRSVSIGTARGTRTECFVLPSLNVDNASNSITSQFFNVTVSVNGVNTIYAEILNIKAANSDDCVFEKSILKDETGIKFKFGDGVNGRLLPEGALVTVNYIETLGKKGNISAKYQLSTMVFPNNEPQIDPRTGRTINFLSCTNISPIRGGKDIESVDEFRQNAPTSYQKYYTISNEKNYSEFIRRYSPLNLLHFKVYASGNEMESINYTSTSGALDLDSVLEVNNYINISALLANGDIIEPQDVENDFLYPLQLSLSNIKGPNDLIRYIAPNKVELALSVKFKTSDISTNLETAKSYISRALANEYDIFNQTFYEPIYTSKITSICKSFDFCDTLSLVTEAVAKADYESAAIVNSDSGTALVKIPFTFDSLYSDNENFKGFKDSKTNSDYLLKVDLSFINDPSKLSKNRTFFLFDNRLDESGKTSIEEAKGLPLNDSDSDFSIYDSVDNSALYRETSDFFQNRQVRIAQFPFISSITDSTFMSKVRSFDSAPVENRPYVTDATGKNKIFEISSVEVADRVSTAGDGAPAPSDVSCYKKNNKYIDYLDIVFDDNSLEGNFYIKSSYLSNNLTNDNLTSFLKQYINLRVYAQPLLEDFIPSKENSIIYIDEDYIKVEKSIITN